MAKTLSLSGYALSLPLSLALSLSLPRSLCMSCMLPEPTMMPTSALQQVFFAFRSSSSASGAAVVQAQGTALATLSLAQTHFRTVADTKQRIEGKWQLWKEKLVSTKNPRNQPNFSPKKVVFQPAQLLSVVFATMATLNLVAHR